MAVHYRFGEFELDRVRGELRRNGELVVLQPKPRRLLAHLLENRHRLVSTEELVGVLWPEEHVAATSLRTCLGRLRKALGPSAKQWIQTRSKEGFRWIGPCDDASPSPIEAGDRPEIAAFRADGGLVGRDREREILSTALANAVGGRGALVVVRGEQGVGKTALVESVLEMAQAASVASAVGQCEEEATSPFSPWVDVLREIRGAIGASAWRDLIEDCAPEMAVLLGGGDTEPDGTAGEESGSARLQFRLADAIARVVQRAPEASPVIILLEDAHWADDSSLLALKRVARGLQRLSRLVLVTCRSLPAGSESASERTLAGLAGKHGARLIEVARLSPTDSISLARRLCDDGLSDDDAKEIYTDSGGVPLLIEQLVEHRRGGRGGAAGATPAIAPSDLPLAAAVVIEERLHSLSDDCQRMLELASVLGTRVEQRWLHLLWNDENADSSERLEKAIEEATRAGVLERTEPSRLLRFHHGLLRKVAYRTIASDRIGHLHWRAGLIGAGTTEPMSPATVAAHLVRGVAAGSAAAALDACAVAAREASSRGAFDAAAALWRQALDMLALQPSAMAPEEAALRIQRATALDRAGRSAEAESDALRAFEIGERVDDPALQAKALLSCAPRIDFDGKVDDALVGRIEATLARLGSGDSVLRSRLLGRLVWATHHRRDGMEARLAVSAEALELARRLGDRAALATALEDRRMVLRSPQHQDEHDRVLREIIAVSRERGDDEGVLRATALSAWSRAARGRLTGAARRMAECRSSLRHVRSPDTTMQLYLWEMMNALLVGRWEEARRVINELVEFATAVDETLALAYAPNQALPEYLRGAGATEGAAAAAALFPARVELRVLFITALLDEGRGDEALDEWKSVRAMGIENEPADGRWLAHVSNLARIAADLEERDLARSLYHRLLPLAEWNAILGAIYTAAPFGAVARPLGLLATSLGLWDEAETHFQTAQRLHRQWNARPWLATTLHDHGHMRLRRGRPEDREAARALLNEAAALANDLEMPNLVRRLRTLPTS